MKATVSRRDLANALAIAADASSVRTALPVLSTIRIEAKDSGLTLIGCDGEMWAKATCVARIDSPGAVCVPQRLLSDIVNALGDGEVTLEHTDTSVMLQHGHSDWKMVALPAEEFPNIPKVDPTSHLKLKAKDLAKAIDSVSFAVSDDSSRQILTGVLMNYDGNTLTMVATDTHRLAVHQLHKEGIGADLNVIVPEKALKIIKSMPVEEDDNLEIGFDESRVYVDTGSASVVAQLLTGQYPNWERVVPSEFTRTWIVDRQELLDNVNRAMILARDNANRIKFSGNSDKVVISARTEDKGEAKEEISIVSKNGDVEIAFNGKYVMDALKAMNSDGIQAEMTESSRPAVLRPTDENETTFCVVMPMAMG